MEVLTGTELTELILSYEEKLNVDINDDGELGLNLYLKRFQPIQRESLLNEEMTSYLLSMVIAPFKLQKNMVDHHN